MDKFIVIDNGKEKIEFIVNKEDLDYYSYVFLKLYIGHKRIILMKDNILFLSNTLHDLVNNIDRCELDGRIEEKDLGKLYNEFLYCSFYELNSPNIIVDSSGDWIGKKYILFSYLGNTTWIYQKEGELYLKVTLTFSMYEKRRSRKKFFELLKGCSDITNIRLTIQDLKDFQIFIDNLKWQ